MVQLPPLSLPPLSLPPHVEQSLCTVASDEFQVLTGLLGKLDHCNTPTGIQETIAMVTEVANLDDDFKVVYVNRCSVIWCGVRWGVMCDVMWDGCDVMWCGVGCDV